MTYHAAFAPYKHNLAYPNLFGSVPRMRGFLWCIISCWMLLAGIGYFSASLPIPVWTAAAGATLSLGIAWTNRLHAKRQATLNLHKEYYSDNFAQWRRVATRFVRRYACTDWTKNDPFKMPDPDNTRSGYSAVIRYWHRVTRLYDNGALDRPLTERLLSRELGYWFGMIFEDMRTRQDMKIRDILFKLRDSFLIGGLLIFTG